MLQGSIRFFRPNGHRHFHRYLVCTRLDQRYSHLSNFLRSLAAYLQQAPRQLHLRPRDHPKHLRRARRRLQCLPVLLDCFPWPLPKLLLSRPSHLLPLPHQRPALAMSFPRCLPSFPLRGKLV